MANNAFEQAANEMFRFESQLKAADLTDYSIEAVDFEKEQLSEVWNTFKTLYKGCLDEFKDKEKELGIVRELYSKVYKANICCVNILAKSKQKITKEDVQSKIPKGSKVSGLKVQPCDVDVFDGDYNLWPSFRDLFSAIYGNNKSLSSVEKLCYLFQKTSGEAREINKNVALVAGNFDVAWKNLVTRFENKRVLVTKQLNIFYGIVACKGEFPEEIKRIQRDINSVISSLRSYDIDVDEWEPLFVYHCSIRLPHQTLTLWEQSIGNKTEVPSWRELNNFLTDRFRALESAANLRGTGFQTSQADKHKVVKNHHTTVNEKSCQFCKKSNHSLYTCKKFMQLNYFNKINCLKRFRVCFNCLKSGHMFPDCPLKNNCSKCKEKHHTLLHREPKKTDDSDNQNENSAGPSKSQTLHNTVTKKVMLATAWIFIEHNGTKSKVRALIDPCSDESFISAKVQKLFKLSTSPVSAEVSGLGGTVVSKIEKLASFSISSLYDKSFSLSMEALVVPKVTGNTPSHSYVPSEELPKLFYADPYFYKSDIVDILLGGDVYPSILRSGVVNKIFGSLVAQETAFGWVVTGPTNQSRNIKLCMFNSSSIDDMMTKFWELEEVSSSPLVSEGDIECEKLFRSTTTRNADGRYIVRLPFKSDFKKLGSNRHIALCQYTRNERSMLKRPEDKVLYDEVLREYETLGHMRKIEPQVGDVSYYLPHHGVFKPDSTTTKLRVVFNASSPTSNGVSLNDILHVGPTLQKDLVLLILKWRFFEFVFNADITKMYRQILVHKDDVKFQRILFRSSPEAEIEDFELNTVTFGVNCAPYLALRTLLQLADDEEQRFPLGSKILKDSLYVDDALVGSHCIEILIKAREQLIGIMSSAGFEMRKWTSNSKAVLEDLPSDWLLDKDFLCIDEKSTAKMLGVRWNASLDIFYFSTEKLSMKESYTKREVLSIIAKLFDPVGWLSPVIIVAKVLMQQMWLDKIDWDDPIKPGSLSSWKNFVQNYNEINKISVPRWIQYSPDADVSFHGFCDASEMAYAAALYIRVQKGDHVYSNLLISKTKVAPVKKPSIPRLELCGAVLLAKLVKYTLSQIDTKDAKVHFWCDSTIVLAWLKKPPCHWKTFVANRVASILEKVGNADWSHVVSEENPADLATRGLGPSELKQSKLWWNGPSWLSSCSWPIQSSKDLDTDLEVKSKQVHVARSSIKEDILDRFSCFSRALYVIAYMFRFFNNVRSKTNRKSYESSKMSSSLTLHHEELKFVRNRLFSLSQQINFPNEYSRLSEKSPIGSSSPLLSLTPYLDKYGVIRANSRLGSSKILDFSQRHPIILAYKSRLSYLYVGFVHKLTHHGGFRLVYSVIRQELWIIRAKVLIKSYIHACKECILDRKVRQGQIMANLPKNRMEFSRPFANTGVDYAGPFDIKSYTGRYCKITKGYVCLFVCFATKAIHLEVTSDMSTPAFMAALTRFVSRRGCPNAIYSDNGRNFVGADKVLKRDFEAVLADLRQRSIKTFEPHRLSWHFIPAAAPHMGGLWEAGVKSFKTHLKKSAGQMKFTYEEFATILSSIEACLNSRPLGPLPDNIDDVAALTPGHFLIGSALIHPAEPEELDSPISIVHRWRKVKAMQHEFARRWKNEYLTELLKRNKWKKSQSDLQINDLVVLRNEPVCPTEWRLAKVVKVHYGTDKKVRIVELKTQTGLITRPVHKLVLLPRHEN